MKRNSSYILFVLSIMSFIVSSCYKDHSSVIEEMIPDIIINDFDDAGYTVESFSGNKLHLEPSITTEYGENELAYEWYIIDLAKATSLDTESYQREHIASGRVLDYEVNLAPGDYTVILEVQAANGYLVSKTTTMHAVTSFSQGYYILKETPEGYTELDLFNPTTGLYKENILTSVKGTAIKAKPLCMSMCVNHSYIDTDTNEKNNTPTVSVSTADGNISVMRTSDLREVHNRNTLLFEKFDDDEIPYKIISCYWLNALISNKGIRSQYEGSMSAGSSGKYGITNGVTAGTYVSYNPTGNDLFFWDERTSSIGHCDYNGTITIAEDDTYKISRLRNTECMHTGYNKNLDLTLFVTRNRINDARLLYTIKATFSSGYKVENMIDLAGKHIAKAVWYTTCYNSAAMLYGLMADGSIWAYNIEGGEEREIVPAGIPSDETIVYISDKTLNRYDLPNRFVVGTMKGDRYTLRFYDMLGGIPDGQPIYTVGSTGRVKAIHYTGAEAASYTLPSLQD